MALVSHSSFENNAASDRFILDKEDNARRRDENPQKDTSDEIPLNEAQPL